VFNEPEIVKMVGSRSDAERLTAGGWDWELGDGATRSDAPDLVCMFFSKPDIAIGTRGDMGGITLSSGNMVLSNRDLLP
jgi:hypothetical protein